MLKRRLPNPLASLRSIAAFTGLAIAIVVLASAANVWSAELSGKADYIKNCAGCHGADGKGNGPDLYVVPVAPANLRLLAKQNGGVFPFQRTEDTIDGRKGIPSHKRFDMPFWGVTMQPKGKEFTPESDTKVKARIDALVRYIESIQQR